MIIAIESVALCLVFTLMVWLMSREPIIKTDFYGNREVPFKAIGKPVIPDAAEQASNPRSRSAKLRIAERI